VKGDILRACVHVRATTLILKYIGKGDVQALGAELLIVAAGYINERKEKVVIITPVVSCSYHHRHHHYYYICWPIYV
jgi:hypothetical protein